MNTVTLIGNAGKKAEVLNFDKNKKATFSLATNQKYQKNGKEVTKTEWHNVVAWGKLAEQCEGLIVKGKFVKIEGKINYRNYTNKQNQKVYVTEIQAFKVEDMAG